MVAISSAARHELVRAVSERYRTTVSADEKGRILDEFVALSGYHRKHAIRVLNGFPGTTASTTRGRLRLYDEAVRQALIVFWEASDRICGKRLKPLLPILLPALEGHGHVKLDPTVRAQLLAVSAATIDGTLDPLRLLDEIQHVPVRAGSMADDRLAVSAGVRFHWLHALHEGGCPGGAASRTARP